jgi:hypothetical protein
MPSDTPRAETPQPSEIKAHVTVSVSMPWNTEDPDLFAKEVVDSALNLGHRRLRFALTVISAEIVK